MPACAPEYSRLARSNSDLVFSGRKRCPHQPAAFTALRRSFSSTFSLIPEEREAWPERPPPLPRLLRLLAWGPRLLLRPLLALLGLISHPAWKQILVVLPTLWIAATLFIFWKCMQCPLGVLKMCGRALRKSGAAPRTVLVSGGSSVQALHLARNFHSAGARVVAVEVEGEGQFALLKYSAAVSQFYTVPRPHPADPAAYGRALQDIVRRERAVFFVPVSASTPAYYDALAKPHLEMLGCQCFVPSARDVLTLDDPLELYRACAAAGLAAPQFWVATSEDDVRHWYDAGRRDGRHFIASAGPRGARDRLRFVMPEDKALFRFPREISAEKPWIIVEEPKGERIVTCTTLKESRAVNNVTCRVDGARGGLVPARDAEADAWVQRLVAALAPARPMTGHVSFRLVREAGGRLVGVGARVGVSLPYLCQAGAGCGHRAAVGKLLDRVLDTREALFAFWDPLPYCAYYRSRSGQERRRLPPEPCKSPPNVPL